MSDDISGLIKALREDVLALTEKTVLLESEVASLSAINIVLAVRLCESQSHDSARTLALLDIMGLHKTFTEPELKSGAGVRQFRRALSSMLELDDPITALVLGILQARDAGPERLAALHSWQSQASDDELACDALELLQRLLGNQRAPDQSD